MRGLGEQQHVVLHAPQFTRGKGPKPARHVPVGIGERHQRAALHHEDRRVGNGLGRKMVLVVHLEAEDVARQIKCLDAAPATQGFLSCFVLFTS